MFKGEIAAYAAEGVVVPNLVFKDNKPILDFIEGKGDGLFSILDEQVKQVEGRDGHAHMFFRYQQYSIWDELVKCLYLFIFS